ncbi:MAG: 3-methyl-2-oxobutanoate hydroxymethyltransferase [Betaproteobacteria bacterium]|nr:3-methyl-2-oxobutanoate hydroxymethyltransferase [Betaproteobacteria bacterium]
MLNPAKVDASRSAVTAPRLRDMKVRGEKIVMLTAYDASFATQCDAAGVDILLVGDSLGMVVQGHASTLPVTLDQMVYHSAAVARSAGHALVLADLPFMTFRDVAAALSSAHRLMAEGGAAMVKVEGAGYVLAVIQALVERQMPVCAHLGLTPQSVHAFGGYKVQGKSKVAAERLLDEAIAVEKAGASLLVLECIPADLAAQITQELRIPTIGIGAGVDCDGQVLVLYDMLGLTPGKKPRFSKDFLAGENSIEGAIRAYVSAVKKGAFPAAEHSF